MLGRRNNVPSVRNTKTLKDGPAHECEIHLHLLFVIMLPLFVPWQETYWAVISPAVMDVDGSRRDMPRG